VLNRSVKYCHQIEGVLIEEFYRFTKMTVSAQIRTIS